MFCGAQRASGGVVFGGRQRETEKKVASARNSTGLPKGEQQDLSRSGDMCGGEELVLL